eukprot:CAMPEP_0176497422 /NCGR_PEP_ID=MMETSP0200_2-20121128/11714_1 /TAXON_ID=947934 /ORGANISM="Chaetoceros sp., Strain GSL56" /LENGTH=413 /DNA_ID=CAMNT_0017895431 /DNA_START=21 /DNA_END=1259 /DNA_ORIENTATION=-
MSNTTSISRKRRPRPSNHEEEEEQQQQGLALPSGDGSDLDHEEPKSTKRSRLNDDINSVLLPRQLPQRSLESPSPPPFLQCHLWMLQSLYTNHHSHNHDIDRQDDDNLDPGIWNQIQQYLSRLDSLQSNNSKLIQLSELVAESKSISQQQQPPAPTSSSRGKHPFQRMNTSLKSETKLSFSFVTQSQQSRVQSLSLHSPSAAMTMTGMMKHYYDTGTSAAAAAASVASPFYYKAFHRRKNMDIMLGRTTPASMRKHTHSNHDNILCAESKIQSMNLVTSILLEKYKAQVQLAIKERQPYMPLLSSVKKQISFIARRLEEMNGNVSKVCDLQQMTEEQVRKLLADANVQKGQEKKKEGDDEEDRNNGSSTTTTTTTTDLLEKVTLMKCQLGLWRALESSLNSVICVVPNNMDSW